MNHFSKYDPFSRDNFFKDGKSKPVDPTQRIVKPLNSGAFKSPTFLFPINESEEFHDPFSDINLFLAKRIKREILREKNPRKWSRKIQSILLKEILPDFTQKFPGYRLGSTALQKTWNKVLYYLQTIQQKKGALKPNGKLNIDYLIKENLRNLESSSSDFHPYNTAHSIAVKISECIAAIDGERPNLEDLTKTIWSIQKHLIPNKDKISKAPFDSIDDLDKIIVAFQLEELAKDKDLTKEDLSNRVNKQVLNLKGLERIRNLDEIKPGIMSLLADKLYPTLNIHNELTKEEVSQIISFVQSQFKKSKLPTQTEKEKAHSIVATRIFFLYKLASQTSLAEAEESLQAAIKYVYSLSTDSIQLSTPVLRQEVYDFIDQEISFLKESRTPDPLQKLLNTLVDLFAAAEKLPKLSSHLFEELEVVIWKALSVETECLAKLPGYLRRVILNELASVHIDNSDLCFQKIVNTTMLSLKKARSIDFSSLDKKIEFWTHQNDMISSMLFFDPETPLLKLIKLKSEEQNSFFDLEVFVEEIARTYLKKHPELSGWKDNLKNRITILFKYHWYNQLKDESQSTYDRFILYQYKVMGTNQEKQFPELLLDEMEIVFQRRVPLFPFMHEHSRTLIQQ